MARAAELLARYYARAFLGTVLEMRGEKALTEIEAQFKTLSELSRGESGDFFGSPVFDSKEKGEVLETYVAKYSLDPALGRLFRLLISEGQAHLFPAVASEYSKAVREHRKEATATLRTAFPLKASERERFAEALSRATGKKVLMDVQVDSRLIGGVVAEVGGKIFDASIRGYLERLQKEFSV